jgi:hypothetical protein
MNSRKTQRQLAEISRLQRLSYRLAQDSASLAGMVADYRQFGMMEIADSLSRDLAATRRMMGDAQQKLLAATAAEDARAA